MSVHKILYTTLALAMLISNPVFVASSNEAMEGIDGATTPKGAVKRSHTHNELMGDVPSLAPAPKIAAPLSPDEAQQQVEEIVTAGAARQSTQKQGVLALHPSSLGMNDLPDELILHIFSFLPNYEDIIQWGLTSTRFYGIAPLAIKDLVVEPRYLPLSGILHTSIPYLKTLYCNKLGRHLEPLLRNALPHTRALRQLTLEKCSITPQVIRDIADILKNGTLTSLAFYNSRGDSQDMNVEICKVLGEALSTNRTLTYFRIYESFDIAMHNSGIIAIIEALKFNETLQEVIMVQIDPGPGWAKCLGEALQVNQSLMVLELLVENNIDDEGGKAMAHALQVNTSLEILSFADCPIIPPAALAMAEALKVNTRLQEVHLIGTRLSDAEARAIAEALAVNQTLQIVSLEDNNIDNEGARALADALRSNRTLIQLDLRMNDADLVVQNPRIIWE